MCFKNESKKSVRKNLDPGNAKSFWKAVQIAQGCDPGNIPETMKLNGTKITQNSEKATEFMNCFTSKVISVRESTRVEPEVFNGQQEIFAGCRNFFEESLVREVLKEMRASKSFGPDRIPMTFYHDGNEQLTVNLSQLFQKIYQEMKIPDQWKCSRILPLLKKGYRTQFANYRPIANNCSVAKIFEK